MNEEMRIRRYTPHTEKECRIVAKRIIELQHENQQLKEELKNHTTIVNYAYDLSQQRDNYKFLLDEIREYIDKFPCIHYASAEKVEGKRLSGKLIPVDDLLQILDKVKE